MCSLFPFKSIRRNPLSPKKKELVKRIRQSLNLSEIDASDKDLLECFGNTTLADGIRFAITGEKLQQDHWQQEKDTPLAQSKK
jgi:hypothetical protein